MENLYSNYKYKSLHYIHRDEMGRSFSDWMKILDTCTNQHELEVSYQDFWANRYSYPIVYLEFANEWVTHLAYLILDSEMERVWDDIRNQ